MTPSAGPSPGGGTSRGAGTPKTLKATELETETAPEAPRHPGEKREPFPRKTFKSQQKPHFRLRRQRDRCMNEAAKRVAACCFHKCFSSIRTRGLPHCHYFCSASGARGGHVLMWQHVDQPPSSVFQYFLRTGNCPERSALHRSPPLQRHHGLRSDLPGASAPPEASLTLPLSEAKVDFWDTI